MRRPRYLALIHRMEYQKGERAAQEENPGDLKGSHLSIQQISLPVPECEKTTQDQGGKTSKRIRENSTQ